jgi:hypothetical protein
VAFDMRVAGIRSEAQDEARPARLVYEGDDPGQDREPAVELSVPFLPLGLQGTPVGPLFKGMPRVEREVGVADASKEKNPVEGNSVGRMDLRVGVYHGRLGVEDQAIEVKNQGAQVVQVAQNGIAETGRQRDSRRMNWKLATTIIGLGVARCALADPDQFSQVVKPADFAAAGLSKLSPEELARLDQLVEAYKSGALEAARQQAAAASAAQAAAEARATQAEAAAKTAQAAAAKAKDDAAAQAAAEKKASGGGLLSKAIVMITPGTKVVYKPVESRIIGGVSGWNAHTIFTLENGQEWQVCDYSHYFNGAPIDNPKVKLIPAGVLGGFRMEIDGIGEMRVRLIKDPETATAPPAEAK